MLVVLSFLTSCDKDNKDYDAFHEQRNIENYLAANHLDIAPRASGLYFQQLAAGSGLQTPADTQYVQVDFLTRLLDGKRIDGTPYSTNRLDWASFANISPLYAQGNSALFRMGATYFEPAFTEALKEMKVGDSVRLIMPSGLAGIPGNKLPVILIAKLQNIIPDVLQWEKSRIAAYLDTIPEVRVTAHEMNVPGTTLKDTLYLISYGGSRNDSLATSGDVVLLDYYGKFIDGTGFELRKGAKLTLNKASSGLENSLVDGFAEALTHVNPGQKVSVILPFRLAYGVADQHETVGSISTATVVVPAYSTLVFDLVLHSITSE